MIDASDKVFEAIRLRAKFSRKKKKNIKRGKYQS